MEIRSTLEGLSKPNYYEAWVENFEPSMEEGFDLDEATLEDYKSKFTVNKFEENLAQYFPLVHKIMQETGTVELEDLVDDDIQVDENVDESDTKENVGFKDFESWADSLVEGTLNPDTLGQLIELLQTGLTFGGNDAFGAIESLENIGMSNHRDWDKLEAALRGAAGANPNGDPKDVIIPWLQKDDPEAAAEIQRMMEPQQAAPAEPAPAPAEPPVAEAEGDEGEAYVACIVQHNRSGQAMVQRTKPISRDRAEEVIRHALSKNTFVHPPFMTIYPASAGKLDGSTIMAKYPDMSKEGMREGPADEPVHQAPDADDKRFDDMDEAEDSMDNAEVKEPRQASTREIAETIMSFCNTEDMTFPKGEEGVIIRCGKMYGPRGEALATRLVDDIKQQREAMEAQRSAQHQFEEIRRLAGLVK
jgi:hypothetical protein